MKKENLKKIKEQIQQELALKYALSQSSLFSNSEDKKIKMHLGPNFNNTISWETWKIDTNIQEQQDKKVNVTNKCVA